jgi:cobalamin biosynthesis protein CobC
MAYRAEQRFGVSRERFKGERRGRERDVQGGIKGRKTRHVTTNPSPDPRQAAMTRLFQHGGDINSAMQAFPAAPRPWIDLSTGVNPHPYPIPELSLETWSHLPGSAAMEVLVAAAARAYGASPERIAAAAGTQAILATLPRLFPALRVSILGPTYGEHEHVWRAAGAEVEIVRDLEHASGRQVVVVNPNNPDGRLFPRAELREFALGLARDGRRLIVDEAFMDFERESVAPDGLPGTIVLRSFGKAHGLAGLRLGFALAEPAVASELRTALGPWPVAGPAIAIGTRALADHAWLDAQRSRLETDAAWLDDALRRAGFEIVGSTPLFRLTRRSDAAGAFESLCGQGILTRPFVWNRDLLRWGIPTADLRPRLGAALLRLG